MYENNGGSFQGRDFAPVKEGDELDVTIESVGEKGDGIAKVEGFVLFVPGTNTGDNVKVKITKVLRKVGFAEVVGKSESSGKQEKAEDAPAEQAEESEEEFQGEDTEDF